MGGGSVIANRVERGGTVENWLLIRGESFEHYEPLKDGGSGKWHCDTTKILWPLPPGDNDRFPERGITWWYLCENWPERNTGDRGERCTLLKKSLHKISLCSFICSSEKRSGRRVFFYTIFCIVSINYTLYALTSWYSAKPTVLTFAQVKVSVILVLEAHFNLALDTGS